MCETLPVAGGMHPGRPGGRSLAERAAESGVRSGASADPSAPSVPASRGPAGEGRHCWVHSPPGAPGTWPGLLIEWRQRRGAWEGRVAYAVPGAEGPSLVESWLPAERLQPR